MQHQYKISAPKVINTAIKLPSSKSMSNRALILNALCLSTKPIKNLSDCEDTKVILDAFNSDSNEFDVKGAGTAMRFLTAFLAGMEGEWILKGSKRMHERPIHPLVETLIALGAKIEYLEKEGYPPLKIKGGPLKGGEVYLAGNISSQFISALLMVAPLMENGLIMHIEKEIVSKPYITLTMEMMAKCGVHAKWDGNDLIIEPQKYKAVQIEVEADWSAASYWYEIAALLPGSEIKLEGLKQNSLQGDISVANLFEDLGVKTEFVSDGAIIKSVKKKTKKFFHDFKNEPDLAQTFAATCCFKNTPFLFSGIQSLKIKETDRVHKTKKFFHDFKNEPDLAQTFAATCCFKNTPFLFSGIQSLKIKETDRVHALIVELKKLGYVLIENEIGMLEWDGERCTPEIEPAIDTYDDHRMALSFAPGAIIFDSLNINDPHVVSKSYPLFWDDLSKAGFIIEERI